MDLEKINSSNYVLTYLHETAIKERDRNNSVCGMFVDFAKAFDTVNHSILLYKLEHNGVRGNAFNLIKSYLSNRKQYTVNNEKISKMLSITIGVPQGSMLVQFLFWVYVNDLPNLQF